MNNTPWKSDLWFTSPWNFAKETRDGLSFSDNLKIHDITLRDGEQQTGITFTREEKVDIAKRLSDIGVHRIEAGMPAVSAQDEAAIKEIVDLDLNAEIFAFSRCMVPEVELAAQCGVKGIVVEIPSSEHIIKNAYGWPLDRAVKLSIEATLAAKAAGLYTVFFPIDASRADMSWFLDLIEQIAAEGHMDALAVVDTFGGLNPHAVPYLMGQVKKRIDKPLEPHFHDDFNLGVANTIMALASGGNVAHTTITGVGERAGNTPMEDLVVALKTMYDIDLGIKMNQLVNLSKKVCEYARHSIPTNRPVVGERLYAIESGIVVSWLKHVGLENFLSIAPFMPEFVGHESPSVVLGKNSGIDSIAAWAEKKGLSLDTAQMRAILTRIKDKALEKKGLLSDEEFITVCKTICGSPSCGHQPIQ